MKSIPRDHMGTLSTDNIMTRSSLHLVRGTLDLLVLKALSSGARHGYAVSQWIKSVTDETLLVEEGSLYPALHRLEERGWIEASWGISDTGRRARFYDLTADGTRKLVSEIDTWKRYSAAVDQAVSFPPREA